MCLRPGFPSGACLPKGTRVAVGLKPYSPQQTAGIRTEPATSVPTPSGEPRKATSAPSPPLDPPAVRLVFQGLSVRPKMLFSESAVYKARNHRHVSSSPASAREYQKGTEPKRAEPKWTYHEGLRDVCFAVEHGALLEEHIDQARVLVRRPVVQVGHKTKRGLGALDLEAILDADGQPVERTSQPALGPERVQMARPLLGLLEQDFGQA